MRLNSQMLLLVIVVLGPVHSVTAQNDRVRFDRDIRPLLSDRCFHCHGPDIRHREADLRLDLKDTAFAERDGGSAIVPGHLEKSTVWERVSSDDEFTKMPPPESNKKLTGAEIDLIKRWIEQGAEWTDHWAFETPQKTEPPTVPASQPVQNPIDQFISRKLQAQGLSPSPEADRRTLIRRLSFDLRGLPPTPEEVEAFVNDSTPDAYERLVDRLLASNTSANGWRSCGWTRHATVTPASIMPMVLKPQLVIGKPGILCVCPPPAKRVMPNSRVFRPGRR